MAFLSTVSGSYVPPTGITTVLREGIYPVVTMVDPYATQIMDLFGDGGDIDSPIYQWPIDNLPALVTNVTTGTTVVDVAGINTQGINEGFTPNFGTGGNYPYAAQPQRVTNYIQMFAGKVAVTDTLKRGKPVGIKDPYNWEVIKVGRSIKKAQEARYLDNPVFNTSWATGTSGDPRRMHSLWGWANTVSQALTGGFGAAPDNTNVVGQSTAAGTLTPAHIDAAVEGCVTAGGEPNVLALSLGVKYDLSAQLRSQGISPVAGSAGSPLYPINWSQISAQEAKIIRNVEIYKGDAAELMMVWSRQMPQSSSTSGGGKAWLLQTDLIQTGWYSPLDHIPLAKTGHNTQGILVGEYGYRMLSPKGFWVINQVTT